METNATVNNQFNNVSNLTLWLASGKQTTDFQVLAQWHSNLIIPNKLLVKKTAPSWTLHRPTKSEYLGTGQHIPG